MINVFSSSFIACYPLRKTAPSPKKNLNKIQNLKYEKQDGYQWTKSDEHITIKNLIT